MKSAREASSPGGRGGLDFEAEKGEVMIEVMELKTLRSGPLDCLVGVVVAVAVVVGASEFSSACKVVVVVDVVPLVLFTSTSLSFASTNTSGASSAGLVGALWENLHSSPNRHFPSR